MKDRELFRLMQLIPEEYPEETAAFLAAHGKAGESGKTEPVIRQKKAEPQAGILWRVLLPAGAAACLAVLIGTGLWAGLREKPLTTASSEPELTEIVVQTETAPTQIAEVTAAVQQTETKTVTQLAVQNDTVPAVQSSVSAVTAAAEDKPQTTARPQAKPQSTAAPEQQPVPGTTVFSIPPRNPDYPPGDVTMDGRVDIADVQLLLTEYYAVVIEGGSSILTPEQIRLGDVYPNTPEDDISFFKHRLGACSEDDPFIPIIPTDYSISYEDFMLILDYYHVMDVAKNREHYGDLTVTEYAQFLNLPPEEPELRFISEPVILQGDTLPADSVSIQNFGDYPVNPVGWTMFRAKQTEHENFSLWYKGTDALADCRIIITGSTGLTEDYEGYYEDIAENGTVQKLTVGDRAVFYDAKGIRFNYAWQSPDVYYPGKPSIIWFSGEYYIVVYTEEQYSDDVIQQIAESFAVYPAA